MLLTAGAKAAGQQHPLTPFSANPSWQQGQKGGESKGGDHSEIRKIKGETIRKIREKRERKRGGVRAALLGRNFRWTARGWKGFQHQILKGSPCIAKLFLGF